MIGAEAAKLLGCTEFFVPVGQRRSWVEELLARECNRHHWPLLLLPPAGSKSLVAANWMANGNPKDCLMPLSDKDLPEGHRLHLVRSAKHFGTIDDLGLVAGRPTWKLPERMDACRA